MSWWWWLALGAVVVVGADWLFRTVVAFRVKHVDSVPGQLRFLLDGGYDRAWLRYVHRRSGLSVRFTKYIESEGIYGLKLVHPNFGNLEPFTSDVRRVLSDELVPVIEEVGPGIHNYVVGDFAYDRHKVARVLHRILTEAFELSDNVRVEIDSAGIDYKPDALITKKRQQPTVWPLIGEDDTVESPGTLSELDAYMRPLRRAGRIRAVLVVKKQENGDFVQFTPIANGVQLRFPLLTERQKSLEASLRQLLSAHGLKPHRTSRDEVSELLKCNIKGPTSDVNEKVRQIISRLLDVTDTTPIIYTSTAFRPEPSETLSGG